MSLVQTPHQYPQNPQYHQFPQNPNYGAQHFPPININIPVFTPPVLTLPPIIIPKFPEIVLPKPPIINIPNFQTPNFQFPDVNIPVINPSTIPGYPHRPASVIPPIFFNPLGFLFDSHSRQCFTREYALQVGGEIEIEFDYKVMTNLFVSESAVIVSWDGKQVRKILPAESGKTLKFKVNTSKGYHQLTFCPEGCATERIHQCSIKNVAIYEKQCVGGWGNNIVKNGDFEKN